MFLLLFIDKCILIIDVSASTFDMGDPMNLQAVDLRNLALGAVIAAAISVGANAGAPTKPSATGLLFGERSSLQTLLGFQAVRLCVGEALDIAGALTAFVRQI